METRSRIIRLVCAPVWQIAILGIMSWLLYLHLVLAYPLPAFVAKYPLTDLGRANDYSIFTLIDFTLTVFAAFMLYLAAALLARHHARDRKLFWVVFGFAVLFAVTLVALYPIAATDIFEYVFHSRILTHYGQNPLSTPPIAFKGDPWLKTVNWAVQASPYGPLWALLTVPGSLIGADDLVLNLLLMKALAAIFYLGCVLVIMAILQRQGSKWKASATLLFAWNPLILYEAPGNGHNGIIMMFLVLLAVYFVVKRYWVWVLPALVASVLVKYVSALLIIPFLIFCLRAQGGRRAQLVYLVRTGVICAVLAIALALPFLAVPSGLLYEADFYSLLAVPTLIYHLLRNSLGDKVARSWTFIGTSITYLVLYAVSMYYAWRIRRVPQLIVLCTWLLLVYLLIGSTHFQPWFVVWVIALGIWVEHALTFRVLAVLTASTMLSYAANFIWIYNIRAWQNHEANIMFVMVIFAPPIIAGLISYLWDAHVVFVVRRYFSGVGLGSGKAPSGA